MEARIDSEIFRGARGSATKKGSWPRPRTRWYQKPDAASEQMATWRTCFDRTSRSSGPRVFPAKSRHLSAQSVAPATQALC